MRPPLAHLPVLVLILLCFAGCSAEHQSAPTASDQALSSSQVISDGTVEGAASQAFYPLELGNHWTFQRHFTAAFRGSDGSTTPFFDATTLIETELECVEALSGKNYVVEHDVETFENQTFESWVRMRQDRSGLYEADVSTDLPPSCATRPSRNGAPQRMQEEDGEARIVERLAAIASSPEQLNALQQAWDRVRERQQILHGVVGPRVGFLGKAGGPASGELTRLRYPLHTGQSWIVRDDPMFSSEDEGGEALHTAVGTISTRRIRMHSDLFGPEDDVVLWFGRHEGFVGVRAHTEGVVTDSEGNPVGTIVSDDVIRLVGIDLVGPGHF